MDYKARLKSLLVDRSLEIGDFTLASGAHSRYYIDARRTTMSAEGQFLAGHVCMSAILQSGWGRVAAVGGLTMGADPLAYSIAHRSWIEGVPMDSFSVRKSPKEHGTGQRIEGGIRAGTPVAVVEDSMTTGGSALKAIDALRDAGMEIVGVLTLVDREEGGRERLEAEGVSVLTVFTGSELLAAWEETGRGAVR